MKPPILYHGSPRNIEGKLVPQKANGTTNHPDNNLHAIYATDDPQKAIFRAIQKVRELSVGDWENLDEREQIFLYHLPSESFEKTSSDNSQYVSFSPVIPVKKEAVNVNYHFNYSYEFL
jgi:hypothetical protein